jgi:dual specificity phosphatase 12
MPISVDHVIDGVYISGWRATQQLADLRQAQITNILKLYESDPYFPQDFNVLENTLTDGERVPESILYSGVRFIHEQVDAGRPVLVMCGAGMSRSATFVLAYMLEKGHQLPDAFRLLRKAHPVAAPHFEMWLSLFEHYKLPYGLNDALDWLHEQL